MHPIRRILCRAAAAPLLALLALPAAVPAAAAQSAHQPPAPAVRTLYYAADGAPDYQDAIAAAVANWNGDVHAVRLAPAGQGGTVNVTITQDTGWPYEEPGNGLGNGRIVIGRDAVDQGYDRTRIVAHEMGHVLGLPDDRNGRCDSLMSGHSAPVSCTNAHPDAAERARVERNFAAAVRPAP